MEHMAYYLYTPVWLIVLNLKEKKPVGSIETGNSVSETCFLLVGQHSNALLQEHRIETGTSFLCAQVTV